MISEGGKPNDAEYLNIQFKQSKINNLSPKSGDPPVKLSKKFKKSRDKTYKIQNTDPN